MSFSMSSASLPVFVIELAALSGILDKTAAFAQSKKIDPSVLLQDRLAPDMFPLVRQVQLVAYHATSAAALLSGVDVPAHKDDETTIDQLKARIDAAIAFVKSVDGSKIDAAAERAITFPLGPTNRGHMKGSDYLNHFVLPNLYFHLTAAYAILRHNGVAVGKLDYLGAIPIKVSPAA